MKELSVLISKKTPKPLDLNSFKGEKPELSKELPPLINDHEAAKYLEETTNKVTSYIGYFTDGNGIFTIIM